MISIKLVNGDHVEVRDEGVALVAGPYPHDVGPFTHVYGSTAGAIVTYEAPQLLVNRLSTKAQFAVFTRPNGTPVWIYAPDVDEVREPLWADQRTNGIVKAIVMVGSFHQAVQESAAVAEQILETHGWV
jgi:hypothetical protein